ncbi:oligosaccharide flippase family protein [Sphingomonas nostoxanthinifaciens]|uniref:oligosaccharide flippase family protein n=1 Tax=Sphingomonas nostoxanthinifaciens TaxID=2872652 RepID=UPI001CC2105F|nr:oligosaccharide flippase family protein [Sphingomonas nostoxanthinifaciens]UAK24314.1 oligosaccharide flippase family protein [Sphingomonas nostoxanthinifaciens]
MQMMSIAARRGQWRPFIRRLAMGGTASIAANVIVTNVLRIVSSMTLARLLSSYAYGVVGVITSIAYMLAMLSDAGFYPFVIRHERADDPKFLDGVWTLRLVRGVVLTVAMLVVAKPAAAFLGKPELAPVIMVWGTTFLLDGLSSLAQATAVREQKLWRLSTLETLCNVITLAGSITSALILRSYWAMIIGMMIGQIARVFLSYVMFPGSLRGLRFSRETQRELWLFSRYIAMSSMLSLVILQADKVVLARMMPLATYGFYAIATTLALAPEAIANPYAQRVLYPIYARIMREDRPALRATYYGARRRVTLLYALAVGGLIGVAPLVVELLYDPRYRPVTPFLQLLAIRVFLRMPNLAAHEVIVALGKTSTSLAANVFRITWLIVGGAVGLYLGDIMFLVVVVATDEVPATLWYWFNLSREGLMDLKEEIAPFAIGLGGLGLGWAVAKVGLLVVH